MNKQFKKLGGDMIADLGEYLREYLKDKPTVRVYVGCDSDAKSYRSNSLYVTTVCMYDVFRKDGVHYIFCKEWVPNNFKAKFENKKLNRDELRKIKDSMIQERLWGEVERVAEVGNYLEVELEGHFKRLTASELMRMKREDGKGVYLSNHQDKLVDLDIDINADPGTDTDNKSNIVYESAVGYLSGLGFRVRCKGTSSPFAANCAADFHIKQNKKKNRRRRR